MASLALLHKEAQHPPPVRPVSSFPVPAHPAPTSASPLSPRLAPQSGAAQSVQSVQPAQSVQSVQPTQSAQSVQPTQPVQSVQPTQPVQSLQPAQPAQPESTETESEEGTLPEEMTFSLSYRHGSIFRSYIPCFVVVNRFSVLKYPNDKRNDRKVKEIALIDAVVDVGDARAADP